MSSRWAVAYVVADPGIPVGGTKGASVHVESLCCAMARLGAAVTVYAPSVVGPLRSAGRDGVRVVPVDAGPVASGVAGERTRIDAANRFFAAVGRHLDANPPDWVHERLTLFAGHGSDLCGSRDLPRVVEVDAPVAAERERHFGLERVEEAREAERLALRQARVLAVSEPLARWAREMGATEAVVVPNGADTVGLDPGRWAAEGRRLRRAAGLDDRVVVGFSGSLKPWHGVELLAEAVGAVAGRLRAGSPPLGLLVVGDGPLRARLDDMARGLGPRMPAVMTGAVPFSEMPGHLAAMDVCAAPYLPSDNFYFSPLKVAEAMAAGKPVVASDFPPVRELLGGAGVLFPPGDAGALGNHLAALAADPDRRRQMGEQARHAAVTRLDWASVAARTMAFATAAALPGPVRMRGRGVSGRERAGTSERA